MKKIATRKIAMPERSPAAGSPLSMSKSAVS
jgi:hypothetical protein